MGKEKNKTDGGMDEKRDDPNIRTGKQKYGWMDRNKLRHKYLDYPITCGHFPDIGRLNKTWNN